MRAVASADSGNSSSSEGENSFQMNRSESAKIGKALKRAGSISRASNEGSLRAHRRRSPTAATMAGSPPNENMFTASHARRMVKSDKDSFHSSVLSPRTQPIVKSNRRTTIAEPRQIGTGQGLGVLRVASGTPRSRESVGVIGKGGWR